jgi:hypothetical protein
VVNLRHQRLEALEEPIQALRKGATKPKKELYLKYVFSIHKILYLHRQKSRYPHDIPKDGTPTSYQFGD